MTRVTGIRFKPAGKIYDFDSRDLVLEMDDRVIVETEQGLGFGIVVKPPADTDAAPGNLKQVLRVATRDDFVRRQELMALEAEAHSFCNQCIRTLGLMMNLFSVESTFDRNKLTFFYTADGRVDFRQLIKMLVKEYNLRIEMRQVGIRNLSKHCGGIGKCGREFCCSSFMQNFEPISIKMAKEQGLSLNPTKISGVCGRLMCCLTFENQTYQHLKKNMPRMGKTLNLAQGQGKVIRQNILKQTVTVRMEDQTEIETALSDIGPTD
ncbi:MAG: regulatory iron-sulfur-containing complex subunit RicT [Desulfotignum sp.]|nr:regulatory iron-sulfur-containing complex subunit RicT [Desulfotignum sp.]